MFFSQWSTKRKRLILFAVLLLLLFTTLFLKMTGCFNILERVPSPNGNIITTVYRGSAEHFYLDDSITFKDEGIARGRSIAENARYIGTWWSPNSRYRLEAFHREDQQELWLVDYKSNTVYNLTNALNRAAYGLPLWENAREVEYTFQSWDAYDNIMHFCYQIHTLSGEIHWGELYYDRDIDTLLEIT